MTHSKGPWNFHPSSSIVGSLIDNGDNNIAIAMPLSVKEECEANARLISAAPDLLEALKWCAGHAYAGGKSFGDCGIVADALSKAEGRS